MTHFVRALLLASLWVPAAGCNHAAVAEARGDGSAAVASTRPTTGPSARETVYYLASDELEGRGVGTKGLDQAAQYIADQFQRSGLRPLPTFDGYFQRFEINTGAFVDKGTRLTVGGADLVLDKSFKPLGFSGSGTFDGPAAFAGYGISSAKYGYDDYSGLDVTGKVVLVMRFEPHNEAGKSRFVKGSYSEEATFKRKAEVAAARGAAALLVVNPPAHHGDDRFVPFAGLFTEGRSTIPVVQVSVAAANALLKQAGVSEDLAALQAKIDSSGKPASMELGGVTASGDIRIAHKRSSVMNVAGLVPGRGKLKNEYVVVGAHYDHVGKSRMFSRGGKDGEIHNGADDNASGVSAMLGLARAFAQRGEGNVDNGMRGGVGRDRRSVIFIAFTGEEWGLLGSQHFVNHPPVPLSQMVAMLNFDMVGRVRNDLIMVSGTGTAKGLEALVHAADAASPLTVKESLSGFGPSDHTSFVLKKIPSLFFFSGTHADYHTPRDDAEKVNYAGIEQVVDFGRQIVDGLASGPRLQYVAVGRGSPHEGVALTSGGGGGTGSGVTLGVVPDYSSMESTDGVRITGTTPGSPAELAGLKDGDVITAMGEKKIADLHDLSAAINNGKAGETIKVKLRRDGKDMELEATLAQRKE